VIVHGGWGGGWEWAAVARVLRERGHDVFTPTLTGMGERAHLGGPEVGLATHVEDVVAVLELEDLHDVVLCGHSYGGMPVSGAADLGAERIALVIYIDALVPSDGQSAFDLLPDEFVELARASAVEHGDGWRVPIPPSLLPPPGWTAEDERARYIARLRAQPSATFAETARISGALSFCPGRSSAAPAATSAGTSAATQSHPSLAGHSATAGFTVSFWLRTTRSSPTRQALRRF
jgi:pimeloyl-ACP methyl ester carboxylesterase